MQYRALSAATRSFFATLRLFIHPSAQEWPHALWPVNRLCDTVRVWLSSAWDIGPHRSHALADWHGQASPPWNTPRICSIEAVICCEPFTIDCCAPAAGLSEASNYRRRLQSGGLSFSDAKPLTELRAETTKKLGGNFAPNPCLSIPLISEGLPLRSTDRTP